MKLFTKVMLALLVLALLLPFAVLKDDAGKPLMSFSKFRLPDFSMPEVSLPDMPSLPAKNVPVEADDSDLGGKDVFYKWLDADGNVHFSTEPPAEGVEYTLMGFDPNANVIPAVIPATVETQGEAESKATTQAEAQSSDADEIGNPYSQESIEKLFDDAKNIQKMFNERLQNIE